MLNYFDGIFKIVNPKLYNSPYNKNIVKVRDVVKNYGIRCNLRYFFKLLSLRIDESRSMFLKNNMAGVYFPNTNINTILFPADIEENIKNHIVDHELFHVAGRIIDSKNFNEGAAESLFRKVNNYQNDDLYAYELEVFVVEFLNKILNNGLYSIFFGNGKLYKYFKKKGLLKQIKSIDKLINLYNNRQANVELFVKYLFMVKHATRHKIRGHEVEDYIKLIKTFRKEKDELEELEFDDKTFDKINKILDDNGNYLYWLIPSTKDCYDYLKEDTFFYKYLEELHNMNFNKSIKEVYFIVLILTNIAKKYGYTNEAIYEMILLLSSDKSSELKDYVYDVSANFFEEKDNVKTK